MVAALLLAAPAPTLAQEGPRTDPEVGSPAESVYGIPLEEARRDAAPDARPGTSVRTNRGVGSSSRVPGLGPRPAPPEGADSERLAQGERTREREAVRAATRVSGDPSPVATVMLLVLVIGIAAAGGVGAGRLVGRNARP